MPSSEKANLQAHLDQTDQSSPPRDLPPAYENTLLPITTPSIPTPIPTKPIPSQNPLSSLSRLSALKFSSYTDPTAKLSDDQTTVTTSQPELLSTQYALAKFIHEQAALPPKPVMVVRGTHSGHSGTVVDFEFKLNLMGMLDIDQSPDMDGTNSRRGRIRLKVFQPSSPGAGLSPTSSRRRNIRSDELNPLDAWIRKFTLEDSNAENRSFTLSRIPLNLPTTVLEGHVRTLIAATKYRGKVTVEFPLLYRDVTVLRQNGNWFTNLLRIYPTKKYEVVESVWTVGGHASQDDHDDEATFAGEGGSGGSDRRRSDGGASATSGGVGESDRNGRAGLVAQEWWKEWQPAIWNAVLEKRLGWVTVEDWMEAKMGVREKEKGRDWGSDYQG